MKAYQATDSASIALIDRFVVHFGHGLPPERPLIIWPARLPMARILAVSASADVGGVESAWAPIQMIRFFTRPTKDGSSGKGVTDA